MRRILCFSSLSIVILVGVMVFSPLASQFAEEGGAIKGAVSYWELDSIIQGKEYQTALIKVDSIIGQKNRDLPRFAFFDHILPIMIR